MKHRLGRGLSLFRSSPTWLRDGFAWASLLLGILCGAAAIYLTLRAL